MFQKPPLFCQSPISTRAGVVPCRPHIAKGFSIVELMISLVLIAIGAALALPSYQDMIEKRQLSRGAEQLLAFVNSAQSEAVKWNETLNVTYSRTGDTNWCVGANLGDATLCDCTVTDPNNAQYCAINGAPWIFTNAMTGDVVLLKSMSGDAGGDNAYSFDPDRGLFANLNDSWDVEMHSRSQTYQVRLLVSNSGRALLCSKDSDHGIPAYKVCAGDDELEEIGETAD